MSGSTWKAKGKCGVLIVTVGADFKPQRPHDLPDHFEAGELFVKNVPLISALGFSGCFNKRALAKGVEERRWAIPIRRGHMFFDPAELDDANWRPRSPRANGQDRTAEGNGRAISQEIGAAIAAAVTPSPSHPITPSPLDAGLEITPASALTEACA